MGRKKKETVEFDGGEHPLGLVAIVLVAPDGSLTAIDSRLKELLKCSFENILNGKEWEKATDGSLPEETRVATWIEEMQRALPGKWRSGSTTIVCRDGVRKLIDFAAVKMPTGETLTIFEDVTEHKKIERLIRRGRDMLRSVSDNMPDLIWAKDMEGRFLFVNKAMCDVLLKCDAPAEAVGKTDLYFATRVKRAGYRHDFGEMCVNSDHVVLTSGAPQKFEEYGYIKGEFVYLEVYKAPLFDSQGDIIGTVGCGRDITDRKRAEEYLRESEERYRIAIEHSNDGVAIVSGSSHHYVNRKYLEIFGYESMEDFKGLPPFFTVHPDDREWVMKISLARKKGEPAPSIYEFKGIKKDGTVIYIQASVATISYRGESASLAYIRDITDKKRSEEAVREREETIRALINASTDATFSALINGTILAANETLARRLGSTVEEVLGTCIFDYWPEDLARSRKAMVEKLIQSKHSVQFEDQRGNMWFENSLYPILDAGGEVRKIAVFSRDITERKRAAEALAASERQYRGLVDNAPVGVFKTNLRGDIIFCNDCWARMFGFKTAAEIISTNVATLYRDPTQRGKFTQRLKKEAMIPDHEQEYITKEGKSVHVLVSATLEGDVISGVAVNITDRKIAERALRKSEEKYRNIFDNAVEGIFQSSPDGLLLKGNRALARMLGFDSPDSMMETYTDLPNQVYVTPGESARFRTILERDGSIQGFETKFHRKDGQEIWVSINARTVRDDAGDMQYFEGFVVNITDRKRAESELRESVVKLNKRLTETIHAMSVTVETRDPYTAGHQKRVAGLAVKIAREMDLPEDTIECIRMAGIIHDIGKLSVPAEILSKPTQLKDVEMSIMQVHAEKGYDILKEIEFPWPLADIVLQHHERLDGSGYPRALTGDRILTEAKILAVADVVESMVSHRPYRPAHSMEEAVTEIISNRGVLYDPLVVDACMRVIEREGFDFE